jgi:hypothetical protein
MHHSRRRALPIDCGGGTQDGCKEPKALTGGKLVRTVNESAVITSSGGAFPSLTLGVLQNEAELKASALISSGLRNER